MNDDDVAKCLNCSKKILGYIKEAFLMCGCCFAFCELKCYNKFLEQIYDNLNFINQDITPFSCNNCSTNFQQNNFLKYFSQFLIIIKFLKMKKAIKTKTLFIIRSEQY